MTELRALCADLVEQLEGGMSADGTFSQSLHIRVAGTFAEAVLEAYPSELLALLRGLAEPEPEGPTDIELLSMAGSAVGHEIAVGEYEPENEVAVEAYGSELCEFARAVLARWGNHMASPNSSPQPPSGEVAELVKLLRYEARESGPHESAHPSWCAAMDRAADLLERLSPQPIPVSERPWEWKGWCDESGRCWWGRSADEFCNPDWHYATYADVEEFCSDAMPHVSLSAHALPLPVNVSNS